MVKSHYFGSFTRYWDFSFLALDTQFVQLFYSVLIFRDITFSECNAFCLSLHFFVLRHSSIVNRYSSFAVFPFAILYLRCQVYTFHMLCVMCRPDTTHVTPPINARVSSCREAWGGFRKGRRNHSGSFLFKRENLMEVSYVTSNQAGR